MNKPALGLAVLLLATLLLSPVWAQGESEFFIPQIVAGTQLTPEGVVDYRTAFRVINRSADTLRVTIQLRDNSGIPLEGFFTDGGAIGGRRTSEVELQLSPFGLSEATTFPGPLQVGWARITASDFETMTPRAAEISVEATLETELRGLSGAASRSTSLSARPPTAAFSVYGAFGATGIALLNPSMDASAEVDIHLVSVSGFLLETRRLVLPSLNKISKFLDDPDLFSELPDFRGTLEVRSSVPLAAAVIRNGPTFWDTVAIFPPRPNCCPPLPPPD